MTKRILVTGADGFIGRHLCAALREHGYYVIGTVRKRPLAHELSSDEIIETGDVSAVTDWDRFLNDIYAVIHLAARAHRMGETEQRFVHLYRKENVVATETLAIQAAKSGVQRFIFLSSIGVNGEEFGDRILTETDEASPKTPYAISKWEAEQALQEVAKKSEMGCVIIRPPLVYGRHVKGNIVRLLRLLQRGIPLPVKGIRNQRSFVSVKNLTSFVVSCLEHPKARNETFFVSDGRDLSTSELISILSTGLGRKARIFPCPDALMQGMTNLIGRKESWNKLAGSLRITIDKAQRFLGWSPEANIEDELIDMARWYRNSISEVGDGVKC